MGFAYPEMAMLEDLDEREAEELCLYLWQFFICLCCLGAIHWPYVWCKNPCKEQEDHPAALEDGMNQEAAEEKPSS